MATNFSNSIVLSSTITDSEFRTLGSFFSNCLESGGVIKTADSGQIDWTTVTFPGANNTLAGYEIRRFSDAMQATDPVFIKILYYRDSATSRIGFRFQIGTGSNGSGTITGMLYDGSADAFMLQSVAGTFTAAVSAGTNRFTFAIHATTSGSIFALERSVNSSNAVTNEGLLFLNHAPSSGTKHAFIALTGTQPAANQTAEHCLPPPQQLTGLNADGNVAVYPYFFFGIGKSYVGRNLGGGFTNDFNTAWGTHTVSLLGANQTMIKIPSDHFSCSRKSSSAPSNANFNFLMRYE